MASKAEQQAAIELAKKLKLERPFVVKLRRLFRSMANDFAAEYVTSGDELDAKDFEGEFRSLILEQYRKTANKFKRTQRDVIGMKAVGDDIDRTIRLYSKEQSELSAAAITETNEKRIKKAIQQAIANLMLLESADEELGFIISAPTSERVAQEARRLLIADGVSRASMIAITETQKMAEFAKFAEIDVLKQDQPFIEASGGSQIVKTWVTIGDDRVRPTHVEAGGQTVDANAPFIVGGYQMMIPADGDMGAPIGEIINCRCSAVYDVKQN